MFLRFITLSVGITFAFPSLAQGIARAGLEPLYSQPEVVKSTFSKGTLLQFWASWCESCRSVMDDLDRNKPRLKSLDYLAISIDVKRADATAALSGLSWAGKRPGRFFWDANQIWAKRFGITSAPTIILLDAQGSEVFRLAGHFTADSTLTFNEKIAALQTK